MADYRNCLDCGCGEFYVIGRRIVCKNCGTNYGLVQVDVKESPKKDFSRLLGTSFDEIEGGK